MEEVVPVYCKKASRLIGLYQFVIIFMMISPFLKIWTKLQGKIIKFVPGTCVRVLKAEIYGMLS